MAAWDRDASRESHHVKIMSLFSLCCPVQPPPLAMMRDERVDTLQSRVDQLSRESERNRVLVEEMQRGTEKLERRVDELMLHGTPSARTSSMAAANATIGAPVVVDPTAEARAERHARDAELPFESGGIWGIARATDWTEVEKRPNSMRKAALFTKVGVGEYASYEPADPGAKFLLVQHVHTALKAGDGRGADPAVWGRAFTAAEFRDAEAAAVKSGATLIKRTPTAGDTVNGRTDVYNESHWLIEDGSIIGVRCLAKSSQFAVPARTDVRFRCTPSGGFELRDLLEDEGGAAPHLIAELAADHARSNGEEWRRTLLAGGGSLTRTRVDAPLPPALFEAPPTAKFEPRVQGEMPLQLSMPGDEPLLFYAKTEPLPTREGAIGFRQYVYSGQIKINNPTDGRISVIGTHSEFLKPDGTWVPFDNGGKVATALGGPFGWGGGDKVEFVLDAHKQREIIVHSIHKVEGACSYTDSGGLNRRLHHSFGTSITVRLTFTDDQGRTKTLEYRVDQQPLPNAKCEPMPRTFADALSTHEVKGDGLEGFECPIWLALDDPASLARSLVCVTYGEGKYYIRCMDVLSNELANYNSYDAYALKRVAFDAVGEGKSEVELDSANDGNCVVVAVVDTKAHEVIGFRAKVQTTDAHSGAIVASASQCMLIDWAALAATRPPPPEFKPKEAPTWSW